MIKSVVRQSDYSDKHLQKVVYNPNIDRFLLDMCFEDSEEEKSRKEQQQSEIYNI